MKLLTLISSIQIWC